MIKVMLVDDEVSALDHIKSIIKWEEHGFNIVAECTNPKKAITLFEQYKPDIIIVDIFMPIMDGIEFSRRILSINKGTIIFLLTAYRDFEYAKQAIEIGVYKYLLKHEIKEKSLIFELDKVKEIIIQSKHNHSIVNRSIIKSALEGKLEHEFKESGIVINQLKNKKNYIFLLIKQDVPYPVIPISENNWIVIQNMFWRQQNKSNNIEYFETIALDKGLWGMLITVIDIHGDMEGYKSMQSFVYSLQNNILDFYHSTVSVIITPVFTDLFKLNHIYKQVSTAIQYSVFEGKNKISIINRESTNAIKDSIINDHEIHELQKKFLNLSMKEIESTVVHLFAKVNKPYKDLVGLRNLCDGLVVLLEESRRSSHMDDLSHMLKNSRLATVNWYSVRDIQNWFIDQFRIVKESNSDKNLNIRTRAIQKIVDYLYENYSLDISLMTLSNEFGMSGERLRHLFKEKTGTTVTYFLKMIRLEKACSLIRSGQYKIYEVAEMTGFNTSQYFSNVFKKVYGITPFEYAEGKEVKGEISSDNQKEN